MHILIINELYAPHIGGQEYRAEGFASAFAAKGWDVTVACVNHDPSSLGPLARGRFGERIVRYKTLTNYLAKSNRGRSLAGVLGFSLWARKMSRSNDYDLVFAMQWPLTHGLFLARDKTIFDWCEVRTSSIFQTVARRVLGRYGVHTVVNPVLGDRLSAIAETSRINPPTWLPSGAVAPTGADFVAAATPSPADGADGTVIRAVFLGRLAEHKRPALAIAAARELCRRGESVALRVAGGGPLEPDLHDESARLPYVEVCGAVTEARKRELLRWANVLVLPSRREGLPNVIVEALEFGVPSVVTAAAENLSADFVTRYAIGCAVGPAPTDIADGLLRVVRDPAYAANALAMRSNFDWVRSGELLEELANDQLAGLRSRD